MRTLDYLSEIEEEEQAEELRLAEEQASWEWEMEYGLCD